jgi:hypothetical protein
MAAYAVSTLAGGLVCYGVCGLFGDGIPGLLLRAVVCVFVPNVIFAALNFRRREFRDSVAMVLRILKRQY